MIFPVLDLAWKDLRLRFARVEKPASFHSCDCGSCLDPNEIQKLLDTDPGELPNSPLVRRYLQNVLGTVGGLPDFTYLLPGFLRLFVCTLGDRRDSDGFREFLWEALVRQDFLPERLDSDLREAVDQFLEKALLEFLRSSGMMIWEYSHEIHGLARVSDEFPRFWKAWWSSSDPGLRESASTYSSSIVLEDPNDSVLAGQRWAVYWRDRNLAFMKEFLTYENLKVRWSSTAEFPSRETIERRVQALLSI